MDHIPRLLPRLLPLKPNVPITLQPKERDAPDEMVTKIYTMMDSLATSPYDRPTPGAREAWKPQDHFECFIYQAARNLACETQVLASAFDRKQLRNEAGRTKAMMRIRGLIMLAADLADSYKKSSVSDTVRKIEERHPATNPEWSPLPEVRIRFKLENKSMDELREMALGQVGGKKEWLIQRIMEKSGLVGDKEKGKGSGVGGEKKGVVGQKRGTSDSDSEMKGKNDAKRARITLD